MTRMGRLVFISAIRVIRGFPSAQMKIRQGGKAHPSKPSAAPRLSERISSPLRFAAWRLGEKYSFLRNQVRRIACVG